jgi:phosphohistidine phosphatase
VAVVGHEPTLSGVALLLAGESSEPEALVRLKSKFATGAVAVLRWAGGWADLAPGTATLEQFVKPRA